LSSLRAVFSRLPRTVSTENIDDRFASFISIHVYILLVFQSVKRTRPENHFTIDNFRKMCTTRCVDFTISSIGLVSNFFFQISIRRRVNRRNVGSNRAYIALLLFLGWPIMFRILVSSYKRWPRCFHIERVRRKALKMLGFVTRLGV